MTNEIETTTIEVGDLGAYLAQPREGGTAGMLLLPMVTGIGQRIRELADDIARAGMTAVSWDPWHGPSADDTPLQTLIQRVGTLEDEACLDEMRRLLDHMTGPLGLERVGVMGWCLGGRFALLLASRDQRLANVVAYHPTVPFPSPPNHVLDTAELATHISAPTMVLYPKADTFVSWDSYARLRDALERRPTGPSILHVYPDAGHGFGASSQHDDTVDAAARALSWPQALAFCQATTTADGPRYPR